MKKKVGRPPKQKTKSAVVWLKGGSPPIDVQNCIQYFDQPSLKRLTVRTPTERYWWAMEDVAGFGVEFEGKQAVTDQQDIQISSNCKAGDHGCEWGKYGKCGCECHKNDQ